jgi:hypothetical protein
MSRPAGKFFAAFFALVLFASTTAQAQDAAASSDIIRPITKSGSAAFIFHINGLGSFGLSGPVVGSTPGVGVKYYIADEMALRVMLAFTSMGSGPDSLRHTESGLGIGVGVEHHFRPLYSTSPYVGAQVMFGTSGTAQGVGSAGDNTSDSTSIGLGVFAGFDWFPTRGIAIGAEMGLGFSTTSSSSQPAGGTSSDHPSVTNMGINPVGNVHAIVYF